MHPALTSTPGPVEGLLNNLFGKGLEESDAASLYENTIIFDAGIPLVVNALYAWQISA